MPTITLTTEQFDALTTVLVYLALDQEELKDYFMRDKDDREDHIYNAIKLGCDALGMSLEEYEEVYAGSDDEEEADDGHQEDDDDEEICPMCNKDANENNNGKWYLEMYKCSVCNMNIGCSDCGIGWTKKERQYCEIHEDQYSSDDESDDEEEADDGHQEDDDE